MNLYKIRPEGGGGLIRFRPRREQQILMNLLLAGERRLIVPKSRRLGMSTLLGIMAMDHALWGEGRSSMIVDKTLVDGKRKLRDICKCAFESMPQAVRDLFVIESDTSTEFVFRQHGWSTTSGVGVTMSGRGANVTFGHISEMAAIAVNEPERCREILTGFIPAARGGTLVIESTVKGGKQGDVWGLVEGALKGENDWKIQFFSWTGDVRAKMDARESWMPSEEQERYFLSVAGEVELTREQQRWYCAEAWHLGSARYGEFPTTFEECWMLPLEGAVYAEGLDKMLTEGRICRVGWDRGVPIMVTMDIGAPQNTTCCFWQIVGGRIVLMDYVGGREGRTLGDLVGEITDRGWRLGGVCLPHDAGADLGTGVSYATELMRAGMSGVVVMPRGAQALGESAEWWRINRMRSMWDSLWINTFDGHEEFLELLRGYRTKEDGKLIHDASSHVADAFGYCATMIHGGYISTEFADSWGEETIECIHS